MASEKQLVWYRFKTASVDDYRPQVDMKEIGMPWWCTGWAADGSYAIIVCYLPEDDALSKYWSDAHDIDMEYRDEIKYTERFPKPKWLEDDAVYLISSRYSISISWASDQYFDSASSSGK